MQEIEWNKRQWKKMLMENGIRIGVSNGVFLP